MKRISFFFSFILLKGCLQAQVYNNGILHVQSSGVLYIDANLINTATSQFNNQGTITIRGNLTNDATITASAGSKLILSGTTQQIVAGSTPFKAADLDIDNSSNVLLQQTLSVSGTANFINGAVQAPTVTSPLLFSGIGATVLGASNTRHLIGWAGAEGLTSFIFPIGNGSKLKPVSLNAIQVPANLVTVSYGSATNKMINGTTYTPPMIDVSNNWWTINAPANTLNVTLNLSETDDQAGAALINELSVARLDVGSWKLLSSTTAGTLATGSVTAQSISNFGVFAIGRTGSPLPVILLDFTGKWANNGIDLQWKVDRDYDAEEYVIEKSNNTTDWNVLGRKTPYNNTISSTYTMHDPAPYAPITYYRLKTREKDGSSAYSKVLKFNLEETNTFQLIPNLISGGSAYLHSSTRATYQCLVLGAEGKVLKRFLLKDGSRFLDFTGFTNGKYQVVVMSKNKVEYTLPFIIAR